MGWFARRFPSAYFLTFAMRIVWDASRLARKGLYDDRDWIRSSYGIFRLLELTGADFEIENVNSISALKGPCVFIGNHMSTLETFALPYVIGMHRRLTFVVKDSLIRTPVFRHIMISRNPVVVGRTNPREDFRTVMEEGKARLEKGVSVVVFPQTTRNYAFNPATFNSIGIKLARRAGVPVMPMALKTNAWGNGRWIKEIGKIRPGERVRVAFDEPLYVSGSGKETHALVTQFIIGKLCQWSVPIVSRSI